MQLASSSGSSLVAGAWAQAQQAQAERNAERAAQQARALQGQAREAQSNADRAQENARSLKTRSDQAQVEADSAQRGLAALSSIAEVDAGLSDLRAQLSKILSSDTTATPTAAPVVNSLGQETGTLVNVTA